MAFACDLHQPPDQHLLQNQSNSSAQPDLPLQIEGPPTSPLHPGAPPRPISNAKLEEMEGQGPWPSASQEFREGGVYADEELNSIIKDFSPDWSFTKVELAITSLS